MTRRTRTQVLLDDLEQHKSSKRDAVHIEISYEGYREAPGTSVRAELLAGPWLDVVVGHGYGNSIEEALEQLCKSVISNLEGEGNG